MKRMKRLLGFVLLLFTVPAFADWDIVVSLPPNANVPDVAAAGNGVVREVFPFSMVSWCG